MLAFSAVSTLTALDLADALSLLRAGANATTLTQYFSQAGYAVQEMRVLPMLGTRPAAFLFRSDASLVVGIDGITTPLQAAALFASVGIPMTKRGPWSANSLSLGDIEPLHSSLVTIDSGRSSNLFVSGYSYGGCLASILAALALLDGKWGSVECVTFGAPRPGDASLSSYLLRIPHRRWMVDSDPVPHFPPHGDEAPLATVQMGFVQAYLFSLYTQPGGGVQFDAMGTTKVVDTPTLFIPIADVNLLAWATGLGGVQVVGHSIMEYMRRIRLALHSQGVTPILQPNGSGEENATPLTKAAFGALSLVVSASPGLFMPRGGRSVNYIPPVYRPKPVFMSGQYHVIWMGNTIAVCKSLSSAKTVSKYIHKCLRELGTAQEVPIANSIASWTAFFQVASSSSLGFAPPWTIIP